jgi:hypothetical protein
MNSALLRSPFSSARPAALVLVALSALTITACDEALDAAIDAVATDNEEAQNAVDSMQQGSLEGALHAALMDPVTLGDDVAAMVAEAEAALADTFTPAGCVTSTVTGPSASLVFQDCSGPYGLLDMSGAVNLAFSINAESQVATSMSAVGLQVNGATIGLNLQGVTTDDGTSGARTYELITGGAGATRDGVPVARAGNYTAVVEGECLVLNGAWSVTIQTDVRAATFTSFKRCASACPDSGSMVWAGAEATSEDIAAAATGLALTFVNGSDTVAWVDRDAESAAGAGTGVTRLSCGN